MRVSIRLSLSLAVLLTLPILRAATTGSISGTALDPSGAVIPGGRLTATNMATGVQLKTTTNEKGFYSFPSLPIGRYEIRIEAEGFSPQRRTGLVIDADSALQVDLIMA